MKIKNKINALIFFLLLMFSLTVMTNSALDDCILPCTGDYAYPFCKVLAILTLIFFSTTVSTFIVIFLVIIDNIGKKNG
jgi:hypothetical protein